MMSWETWDDEERQVAQYAVSVLRAQREVEDIDKAHKDLFDAIEIGDEITFWDYSSKATGVVTRKGTIAGWALVAGIETRFEYSGVVSVKKAGE